MNRSSASILIVEDNPDHAELIEATIRDCEPGIRILNLKNGEEALEHLTLLKSQSAPTPDLIFMDIKMPRMNGIETLIALKQDIYMRDIPVIMLSTSTNESEMRICLKSGAEIYLAKPLQAETFKQQIRPLLEGWSKAHRKNLNQTI
ncbi:MAG TPA: response regulator [Cellvibrio sp.]|nr:response regulator [Cellvibrio sp.]